jgi:hypothetical protein
MNSIQSDLAEEENVLKAERLCLKRMMKAIKQKISTSFWK